MSQRLPIRINVFLDNKIHGMRRWSAVPRVGELFVVAEAGTSATFAVRVERVVWGISLESRNGTDDAEVDLYVTRAE